MVSAQYCRFVHTETAPAKPMRNKGSDETNSEGFSAHPELSRRSAAHARRHPTSSGRLCEVLDRILAVVHNGAERSVPGDGGAVNGSRGTGPSRHDRPNQRGAVPNQKSFSYRTFPSPRATQPPWCGPEAE